MLLRLVVAAQAEGDSPDEELSEALPSGLAASDWIQAGTILAVAFVAAWVVGAVVARVIRRSDSDLPVARGIARIARNVIVLGGIVYSLASLGVQLGPLLGALGIGGLAIAFAAQTILENTFASILLRTRRPIRRGDQITAADHDGEVVDITLRVVVLRTYDGQRVLLPCSEVLNNPIINHTTNGIRRTTLAVGVAYDTPLAGAAEALMRAVRTVDEVAEVPAPAVWVEAFGESSIDFAVQFWHQPDNATLWRVRSAVAMAVKAELDAAGITIPFPQRTVGVLPGSSPLPVAPAGPAATGTAADSGG